MREAGTFSEGRKGHIPRARTSLARPDQDVVVVRQSSASFHWAKNGEGGRTSASNFYCEVNDPLNEQG